MADRVEPIALDYRTQETPAPASNATGEAIALVFAATIVICLPPFSMALSILALTKAIRAQREVQTENRRGGSKAVVAMVLASFTLLVAFLLTAMMAVGLFAR